MVWTKDNVYAFHFSWLQKSCPLKNKWPHTSDFNIQKQMKFFPNKQFYKKKFSVKINFVCMIFLFGSLLLCQLHSVRCTLIVLNVFIKDSWETIEKYEENAKTEIYSMKLKLNFKANWKQVNAFNTNLFLFVFVCGKMLSFIIYSFKKESKSKNVVQKKKTI